MEERTRFIRDYERELWTMTELCSHYGIARKTGYKIVAGWQEHGLEGMKDLSRAPQRHPNQTAAEIEEQLLELRRAHMRWGPRNCGSCCGVRGARLPRPARSERC